MNVPLVVPPYPYDRLGELRNLAKERFGEVVDLSVGTPTDPPPAEVVRILGVSGDERGYPPSVGSARLRQAEAGWLERRFGVKVPPEAIGNCVGTKEFVASVPHLLGRRRPERDTVLYPELSYPTYAMGASLAGVRAVAVPLDDRGRLDLSAIAAEDIERAACLWVNSPANPTGAVDDLDAIATWGRAHEVLVLSDECYVEFTWAPSVPSTILATGLSGVVAVHSLSKRSNLAGLRVGFYAGDPEVVSYLTEVRKHAGLMIPGPSQAAAAIAWDDDSHVAIQRERYRTRLEVLVGAMEATGGIITAPEGTFYLWVAAPGGDGWEYARQLAGEVGILVSPGEFYGPAGYGHVRVAAVAPDDQIERAVRRLVP